MSLRLFLALSASALLHAAGGFALAAWMLPSPNAILWIQAGKREGVSLTMTLSLPQHSPPQKSPEKSLPLHAEVTVTPRQATIARQKFALTPATEVSPTELLPADSLAAQLRALPPELNRDDTATNGPGRPVDAKVEAAAVSRSPIQAEPPDTSTQVALESPPSSAPVSSSPQQNPQGNEKTTAPDFTGNLPPVMPEEARLRGWSGEVLLRIHVDMTGRVTQVELLRSSGYPILDAAAASAIRTWKGTPAMKQGRPVASSWRFPISFGY